jgi:hypothetical protein
LVPPDFSANFAATCASALPAAGALFGAAVCARTAEHISVIASTLACRSQLFIFFSRMDGRECSEATQSSKVDPSSAIEFNRALGE